MHEGKKSMLMGIGISPGGKEGVQLCFDGRKFFFLGVVNIENEIFVKDYLLSTFGVTAHECVPISRGETLSTGGLVIDSVAETGKVGLMVEYRSFDALMETIVSLHTASLEGKLDIK